MAERLNHIVRSDVVGDQWSSPSYAFPQTPAVAGDSLQRPSVKARLNVRACDVCRKMKVRCDGFDNPPCVRCRKSGRECLFQVPPQSRNQDPDGPRKRPRLAAPAPGPQVAVQSIIPTRRLSNLHQTSLAVVLSAKKVNYAENFVEHTGQLAENDVDAYQVNLLGNTTVHDRGLHPNLPSIYSESPLDAVNEPAAASVGSPLVQTAHQRLETRSQDQDTLWSFTNSPHSSVFNDGMNIPKRDLRGMIKIFREKLLLTIPVFSIKDFQDPDHLIETDPSLVCCICYVTAQFLSGGKRLREMLMPKVAQILKGKFSSGQNQLNEMSTLKALIVLYGYARISAPSPQDSEVTRPEEILYWPLKSLVEVYALRLSLHRSLNDLQAELRLGISRPIVESPNYQKYMFWLQLFIWAKHASATSGTPPSIPIDSNIRAAPVLLEEIGLTPQASLFGQVELSIIWEKVDHDRYLGEWWCQRDPTKIVDEQRMESVLRKIDHLIDMWYAKWENYINDEEGGGGLLDYYGRCSRFWFNSYATRCLQNSSSGLSLVQEDQIRTCVTYASRVLDWPLDLSPFQKESLRYLPEHASIMVSFSCLYIIASCQTFGSSIPELYLHLDKVSTAAQLMLDMAPDTDHNAHIQGSLIVRKVAALRKQTEVLEGDPPHAAELTENNLPSGLTNNERLSDVHGSDLNVEGLAAIDMFWDFSMMTPRAW